jgi:TRAP-type mannitol/chloroaromatic compound transport system permease small subunit
MGNMTQPPPAYLGVIRAIDWFTEKVGLVAAFILVPILFVPNVYEVFSRYVLHDPTIWALDVTTYAFGALFMIASSWALLKGAHVRTDILWDNFSDRTKGIIDCCAFLFLFLPTMAILTWTSWDDFIYSMSINERSNSGAWQPVIWPLRAIIPFSCSMLFLQGLSELMKSLWTVRTGELLVKHGKFEV